MIMFHTVSKVLASGITRCGARGLLSSCFLAASITWSLASHAECQATGCYSVYVQQLQLSASSGFWIQTSGNETLANCTPGSSVFLHVSASAAQFKEIYATLLTAQQADRVVDIVVFAGSNPCEVAYINLARQ
jgi:hypothetical protein